MANIAEQLTELINLKSDLADNISAKGISADKSEVYNTLIDKVNDIEELRGEEVVLENTDKYNDVPSSVVSVEYPDIFNMATGYKTTIMNGITFTVNDDMSVTMNGTATSNAPIHFISGSLTLEANSTYAWNLDIPDIEGIYYTLGKVQSNIPAIGTYTATTEITGTYLVLVVQLGTTVNNVTVRQPIFYKKNNIGVQLSSKNLFDISNRTKAVSNGLAQTTKRNLTGNQYFVGITGNNYWNEGNIAEWSIDGSTVQVKNLWDGTNGYGIGFDIRVKPNTTYTITHNNTDNGIITIGTYTSDGTWKRYIWGVSTFTTQEDEDWVILVCLQRDGDLTLNVSTVSNIQLELGTVATTYTPYISDFSNNKLNVCGKNLIPYPYVFTSKTNNGITYTVNSDGTITANGTFENINVSSFSTLTISSIKNAFRLPLGKTYTISGAPQVEGALFTAVKYCNLINGQTLDGAASYQGSSNKFTTTTDVDMPGIQIEIKGSKSLTTLNNVVFKPQLELGSTATPYEPYQGQTYTPTADGKVSNIQSIYPITNIFTDNAGALITVKRGAYKQILPSSGKNGITKVWQEVVGSNIDENIKPENIKKGITILGVTGTME